MPGGRGAAEALEQYSAVGMRMIMINESLQ